MSHFYITGGPHGAHGAGGADVRDGAAADAAGAEALAAAIVVIRCAVYAAAILKTIDIDHPLCESTGISPADSSYAGVGRG